MTIKELYEHVSVPCSFCQADVSYCKKCEIGKAIDLVNAIWNHFKKYHWHDLRKDQADLPEQEGMVLVSLNGKLGSVSYVHAVESRYYIPGDAPFYGDPYMNGLVEAWKEIEPFEEENE